MYKQYYKSVTSSWSKFCIDEIVFDAQGRRIEHNEEVVVIKHKTPEKGKALRDNILKLLNGELNNA